VAISPAIRATIFAALTITASLLLPPLLLVHVLRVYEELQPLDPAIVG
jgi:hypothetical protein